MSSAGKVSDCENSSLNESNKKVSYIQEMMWVSLIVIVFASNFLVHPVGLTIRGEESRRGRIAWEMLHTGDWVVPRLQNEPRLTRPPLHYWTIAICSYIRGEVDEWGIRLPSLISVLLTSLVVYWYMRNETSPAGSFFAGVSVATFGQVLQLGRLGESDATFMFLFGSSLLFWHGGRMRGWSPWAYHLLAYSFLAGATLTKGPQAPVYFAATIGLFLIIQGKWRELFSPAHLCGAILCLGLVQYWHYLFLQQLGLKELYIAYFGEVEKRFTEHNTLKYTIHLLQYPLEVLFAGLFPWSLILGAFFFKSFRELFRSKKFYYGFPLLAMIVAWPTVWLPASSNTRYFLCMFPCVAVILGYVVETMKFGLETKTLEMKTSMASIWNRFRITMTTISTALLLGLVAMKFILPQHAVSHERLSIIFLIGIIAGLFFLQRISSMHTHMNLGMNTLLWGLGLGIVMNGPVFALMSDRSNNAESQIASVRKIIPPDQHLVSIGLNHHLFSYYWNDELPIVRTDPVTKQIPESVEYFCLHNPGNKPLPDFGFRWEEITRVNCDRNLRKTPFDIVIIGRVVREQDTAREKVAKQNTQHSIR